MDAYVHVRAHSWYSSAVFIDTDGLLYTLKSDLFNVDVMTFKWIFFNVNA